MKRFLLAVLLPSVVSLSSPPWQTPFRLASAEGDYCTLDSGEPGATLTGKWYVSGGAEPYGPDSLYSQEFGATCTYVFATGIGEREISLWWTEWKSRLEDVPVEIEHAGGVDVVYVDQRTAGGQWNPIGRWTFDGLARVTIHSVGGGSTCADGLKHSEVLPPVGPPPFEIIVDNGDPGTSSTGTWLVSGGANPYGANSLYTKEANIPDPIRGGWTRGTYTFEVPLPEEGEYDVSLWWTAWPSRRSDVRVWVEHVTGSESYWIDQRTGGGRWNVIARRIFRQKAKIIIVSPGNGTTCADAVKLTRVDEASAPSEFVIDNRDDRCTFTGNWAVSGGLDPYGADSVYSKSAGARSSFHFEVPAPGWYEIYLWWTEWPSRLGEVPVECFGDYELRSTRTVDQRSEGGQWVYAGALDIAEVGEVTIHSLGGGTTCVDALRVVKSTE